MNNKKVAILLAGTAFTASMLGACGVYGSPEAQPDSEVIEAETESSEIFKKIEPSDNPDDFNPAADTNISVYGPPESFDLKVLDTEESSEK